MLFPFTHFTFSLLRDWQIRDFLYLSLAFRNKLIDIFDDREIFRGELQQNTAYKHTSIKLKERFLQIGIKKLNLSKLK